MEIAGPIYADLWVSTGAEDTSKFHQLLDGNNGGKGPPVVLIANTHAPALTIASRVQPRRDRRIFGITWNVQQGSRQGVSPAVHVSTVSNARCVQRICTDGDGIAAPGALRSTRPSATVSSAE